ncbi:MAG: hypothetical protein ABIA75_12545 [Candidatus Neomarinimicrobiota bacterium]
MSLRTKILSGFFILSLMLAIAGGWSIMHFNFIGSSVQKMLNNNYKSINSSVMMIEALEREDSGILLLHLGRWREGRRFIESADSVFICNLEILRSNITEEGEDLLIHDIQEKYIIYKNVWEKPTSLDSDSNTLDWYFAEAHRAFLEVKIAVNELVLVNDRELYNKATDLRNAANRAAMPGIVSIVAALVFSLIFSYLVNHFMIKPIIMLIGGIHNYNRKGAALTFNIRTKDEIGQLARELEALNSRLNQENQDR